MTDKPVALRFWIEWKFQNKYYIWRREEYQSVPKEKRQNLQQSQPA